VLAISLQLQQAACISYRSWPQATIASPSHPSLSFVVRILRAIKKNASAALGSPTKSRRDRSQGIATNLSYHWVSLLLIYSLFQKWALTQLFWAHLASLALPCASLAPTKSRSQHAETHLRETNANHENAFLVPDPPATNEIVISNVYLRNDRDDNANN
jgi:hypothetical protein